MNLIKYQSECENTKSNKFFAERVSRMFFVNAVLTAIEALNRLDAIKKSLFYGKSSTQFPVNGNLDDGIETCASLQIHALHDYPQPGLDILHGVIGKATEASELLEALLLAVNNGQKLDRVNIIEEVGDGFWYDGIILNAVNSNFHEVARINNAKLKKRFPDKFKTENAITRDLDAERETLEDKPVAESDGDMLKRLGTDGHLWAEEFCQHHAQDSGFDVDVMRSWFANAIEQGRTYGRKAEQKIWLSDENEGRDRFVRTFLGWLSGEVCELHSVEIPKLAAAYDKFKAQFAEDKTESELDVRADLNEIDAKSDRIREENAG